MIAVVQVACEASVVVTSPTSIKPAEQRFKENDEKGRRKCVSLHGSPFDGDRCGVAMLSSDCGPGLFVEVTNDPDEIVREAQVEHDL